MKKLVQSLFLLLLVASMAFAQDKKITGKVTSKDDGLPLPGVSVKVSGTQIGTQTDVNGNYSINVPSTGRNLEFSFIGFLNQTVSIGAKTTISASLDTDNKQLTEVVVTGYGTQLKKDLAGAVTQIKGSEIENMPIQSFDRAMQGRMSGVQVTGSNGYPGGAVQVRIRGTGSINAGNAPLYVIDGVQVTGGDLSRNANGSSNSLAGINPNDIESIDVLKDASAAAIYGAQAANGVVVITTKKGKAGKTKFNITYQTGINDLLREIPLTNGPEFLQSTYESRSNQLIAVGRNPLTDARTTTEFVNTYGFGVGSFDQAPTFSWIDAATQTGLSNVIEASASGGSDNTTFFMSGSYNNTQGQLIKTDFNRGTFRANINHKASSKLSFDAKVNLSTFTQNAIDGSNAGGSTLLSALTIPSVQPIYNADGSFAEPVLGTRPQNVIKVANFDVNRGTTNQLLGSAGLTYNITKDLSFKSTFYMDYTDILEDRYIDPRTVSGSAIGGQANALNTRQINWSTDQVLNYNKKFGADHDFGAIAGLSYRNVVSTTITAQGRAFPNELFQSLQNAATPFGVNSSFTTWRLAGYFTRANYTFKGKYILNGTLRYDGSSRFGADKKFGLFPSVGTAWRITEEKFLKDNKVINELKLRASYGITGNSEIANFASRSLFGGTGAYNNLGGINPSQLGNDLLTWEESHSLNFGLDYGFLNNRISGTIDVFRRDSKNLLLDKPIPSTSGFTTISENVGQVRNEGIEFELSSVNIDKKFKWTTDFNVTFIRNEVIKLLDGQDRIGTTVFLGESLGAQYVVEYAGVNAATGRGFFYDKDNNPTYLPLESGVADARRIIGSTLPTSFGGLTNTFSYGGFEVSVLMQAQFGNINVNNNAFFAERSGAAETNYTRRVYDRRWLQPGQITDQPRFYGGTEPNHRGMASFSSRNYEETSYIRLKQVSIGYDVNQKLLSKIKVNSAKFFLQAVNLATITGYTGYDPELVGGDLGVFPQGRMITAGIQIGL